MWVVVKELEALVGEVVNVLHLFIKEDIRKRSWLSLNLRLYLLHMVRVDMYVTKSVHKVSCKQPRDVRHHHQKERVGCDVERNTKEEVCTALVDLQRELIVSYVELHKAMAGR